MENTNNQSEQEREPHEPATSYRDLGTAGGGTIPSAGSPAGNPPGGMSTSSSTVEGGTPSGAVGGAGAPRDRGSATNTDLNTTSPSTGKGGEHSGTGEAAAAGRNTIDPSGQSNLGGRNPGQPQTPMGDQDASAARRDYHDETSDAMTSRSPDTANKQKDQEG